MIDIDGSTIITEGTAAYGIWGEVHGTVDTVGKVPSEGGITINARNGSVTTGTALVPEDNTDPLNIIPAIPSKGVTSFGIYAEAKDPSGPGDIQITTRDFDITTLSTAIHPRILGTYAYGIYAVHRRSGNIDIDLGQGSSVTTEGQNSHGVVTYHYGTADTRTMDITLDGPVTVNGALAQGVRVGTISSGTPARMAALDTDGYRQQTVTVNSSISSKGGGIYLVSGRKPINC